MRRLPRGIEFEMLHRVGDVDGAAIDTGFLHCAVHHLSRGADERPADGVFLVAGLLADEHHLRVGRAFAEHRLRGRFKQMTTPAIAGFARGFQELRIATRRQHDRSERRPVRRARGLIQRFRFRNGRIALRLAQQRGVMRVPPRRQRGIVRDMRQPGAEPRRRAVLPMRAAIRRDNGTRQFGKPPRHELRVRLQHVMRRRVPPQIAAVLDRHEAQQRAHLVRLRTHRVSQPLRAPQFQIVPLLQQFLARVSAPDQAIQQSETLRLPCLERQRGHADQRARHVEAAGAFRQVERDIVRMRPHRPAHIVRRHARQHQSARRRAPALPIGLAVQHNPPHCRSKLQAAGISKPMPARASAPAELALHPLHTVISPNDAGRR